MCSILFWWIPQHELDRWVFPPPIVGFYGGLIWLHPEWKNGLANDMFFMPDFDETDGYYEAADAWW